MKTNKYAILATTRCGTTWTHQTLYHYGISTTHEKIYVPKHRVMDPMPWPDKLHVDVSWGGPYHLPFDSDVFIIHQVRHPLRAIASLMKGPVFMPTDDVRADMDKVRAFLADKVGLHPEQSGEIRLREEDG